MKLKSKRPVAFQGEHGAFSEMAVFSLFGDKIKLEPSNSFFDVFEKVKSGVCDYGVLPVENTLGGVVYQVWDLLDEYNLHIISEIKIKIEQCLIVNVGTKIGDIKKVYAHYQAAIQCNEFLRKHKNWIVENTYDTAGSVKMIKDIQGKNKFEVAAIASKRAAEIYSMKIINKSIQDSKENYTRFVVLSSIPVNVGNKITFEVSIGHKLGSLLEVLEIIKKYKINLTSIHSRPDKNKPFRYNFFLEGIFVKLPKEFFSEIKKNSEVFKMLGVYSSDLVR